MLQKARKTRNAQATQEDGWADNNRTKAKATALKKHANYNRVQSYGKPKLKETSIQLTMALKIKQPNGAAKAEKKPTKKLDKSQPG